MRATLSGSIKFFISTSQEPRNDIYSYLNLAENEFQLNIVNR